ncbi:MAG: N-acetyl-gamma-glutamyl-phosphate reductase [Phycisphaeraceae bacterium]|nr:N-acetyl-gamma-glutamyl-phosphate reductase [Phycisphaeraceae bacterium]
MTTPIRAAVVGASGYTGAELIDILLRHPHASLVALFGSGSKSREPQPLADLWPRFRDRTPLHVTPLPERDPAAAILAAEPDAVFLATPHEASLELAAALIDRVPVVVDLSAAFRLSDPAAYPKHYAFEHTHASLLERAVYGLPELSRARLPGAKLIAAPGCYPTSAILPLAPLAATGAIRPGCTPVIDSTSGVSGAGRSPSQRTLFCEVSQSPYGVLRHRHSPEIAQHAGTPVHFVPHLGPYDRGILTTIHLDLADAWTEPRARDLLTTKYASEPFVRVLPPGAWPSVGAVRNTNTCDIALIASEDARHLVLCSAIDNLVKGASGQAVQAMNAALSLPETAGL